jgi:hypothetical protein
MSVKQRNGVASSLLVFQIAEGPCAKLPTQARARVLPGRGPVRAGMSPVLFNVFPFLFVDRLRNA